MTGYGYDYLQKIAEVAGWNYQFINCDWLSCQKKLKEGEIDLLSPFPFSENDSVDLEYSRMHIGQSFLILAVRQDERRFSTGDYQKLNGIQVGMLSSSDVANQFLKFSETKGFVPRTQFYKDEAALHRGLFADEIDAVLQNSEMNISGMKVIEKFNPTPFFIVAKKGNKTLIEKLDRAILRLNIVDPLLPSRLNSKYFVDIPSSVTLSIAETEYLQEKKEIKAVILSGHPLMIAHQDGVYSGIIGDTVQRISDELGVKITLIPTKSRESAMLMAGSGAADIILDMADDYMLAKESNVRVTFPYQSFTYCAVIRRSGIPENPTVAIERGHNIARMVEAIYKREQIYYYEDEKDAVQAVFAKDRDIAYINCHLAGSFLADDDYFGLISVPDEELTQDISIGVSNMADPLLFSILNKQLIWLARTDSTQIGTKGLIRAEQSDQTDSDFSVKHLFFVSILSLVFAMFAGYLFEKRRMNAKIKHDYYNLAYQDKLTGLKNYSWLEEHGSQIMKENPIPYALISFNIYRFELINEYYGWSVGDKIIRFVAESVSKEIEGMKAVLIRSKSDHFVCLLPYTERQQLIGFVAHLRDKYVFYREIDLEVKFNLVFGIYLIPEGFSSVSNAIDYAEAACVEASQTVDSIFIFNETIRERMISEKALEEIQSQALQNGEFKLFFQPQVDMRTGKIVGAETLVRWLNPENGFLFPGAFIPLLENNNFIVQLDYYILEEVFKMIRRRLDTNQKIVPISVNQSRKHLTEERYVEKLQELFAQYNIPKGLIELELTETAFANREESCEVLDKVKLIGFRIAIDDFGTGFSSLTVLNENPIDTLKIDKSFIEKILVSQKTMNIVTKTVEMAQILNMQIVAEGVETNEQSQFLQQIGCYLAQGYLYSKPISQANFEDELDQLSDLE